MYSSFKYIVPSYADADYGLCLQYLLVCTLYSSFKYIVPSYADADYGLCLQYLLAAKVDWSKIINKQVSYNMVQRDQKKFGI